MTESSWINLLLGILGWIVTFKLVRRVADWRPVRPSAALEPDYSAGAWTATMERVLDEMDNSPAPATATLSDRKVSIARMDLPQTGRSWIDPRISLEEQQLVAEGLKEEIELLRSWQGPTYQRITKRR